MTDRHLKSRASLSNGPDRTDVAQIQAWINTLCIHIERYGHYIHVARTLTVTEERPRNALRTGQQAQLCAGDARSAIIVRVQADDSCLAITQVPAEPFDLVCMIIRCCDFNSDRKVQDDLVLRSWLPHIDDSLTDLKGKIDFGRRKAFGRVLHDDLRPRQRSYQLLHEFRAARGNVDDVWLLQSENDPPLEGRGRIIEVDNRLFCSTQRLKGARNELIAGLHQRLDGDIIGNVLLLDQQAYKVKFDLRGCREAHLDLFEPDLDQELEHLHFFPESHWDRKRLVAIAQIDAAPDGCCCNCAGRPLAIRQIDGRKRLIFRNDSLLHTTLYSCARNQFFQHDGSLIPPALVVMFDEVWPRLIGLHMLCGKCYHTCECTIEKRTFQLIGISSSGYLHWIGLHRCPRLISLSCACG